MFIRVPDHLLLVYLLIFKISLTQQDFLLYDSNHISTKSLHYDCLLYDASIDIEKRPGYLEVKHGTIQVIPFCKRPLLDSLSQSTTHDEKHVVHGTSITFEELKSKRVTSEQLFSLSTAIDVIEKYQAYLEYPQPSLGRQIYYNCSESWFGEYCQYSFNSTCSFEVILYVHFVISSYTSAYSSGKHVCYTFISCTQYGLPYCLDWREICDGKIDCFDDGHDEIDCEILFSNECNKDEFRCDNGLCIPKDFANDRIVSPDCIDRSDEQLDSTEHELGTGYSYSRTPTFRFEETACRNELMELCHEGECSMDGCFGQRNKHAELKFSREANRHLSFDCWTSLLCLTSDMNRNSELFDAVNCEEQDETEIHFRKNCPVLSLFPAQPVVLNHVRFIYSTLLPNEYEIETLVPHYVCYDQELCDWLPPTLFIQNLTCRRSTELDFKPVIHDAFTYAMKIRSFFHRCSTTKNKTVECPKWKPYRCANSSKCIALNRLVDGFWDCFQGDDEQITNSCSLPDADFRFRCVTENKCIPIKRVNGQQPLCIGGEDGRSVRGSSKSTHYLSFTTLCNGFIDRNMIDGLNYSDEMDCENWPCANAYTRCDKKWNCPDLSDEVNCSYNLCRPHGHPCLLPISHQLICLPFSKINDGHVDCLGGYDERNRCSSVEVPPMGPTYRCFNETKCIRVHQLCSINGDSCSFDDDKKCWCKDIPNLPVAKMNNLDSQLSADFYYETYLDKLLKDIKNSYVYFTLHNHHPYPTFPVTTQGQTPTMTIATNTTQPDQFDNKCLGTAMDLWLPAFCNRGISVYQNNFTQITCLCPPAYFGSQCEYQSQRVSLTLRFRTIQWRTSFIFVIKLVDETEAIHSWEQIDYLPVRDCQKIFNLYLLYLMRPKNINLTYHIHIDAYYKNTMKYVTSMFYPIRHLFLPVSRLSIRVDIPIIEDEIKLIQCPLKCVHGQCKYFSNIDKYFCHCSSGYAGILCATKIACDCSPDSICVGVVNNRSICICPTSKFGPRCYLKTKKCTPNPCSEHGQCIIDREKLSSSQHYCLCSDGYLGKRCEIQDQKIEFFFDPRVSFPQVMLIHFVNMARQVEADSSKVPPDPIQTTIISKTKYNENSTIVYFSERFYLIFVEFDQNYYLALLAWNKTLPINISTKIIPEHRCLSIKALLPSHIQNLPRWHRVKHYHVPCQNHSTLTCFYDNDYFMCLCDIDRHANCFKFDFHPVYDCLGYNYCENEGQCYINSQNCPTSSSCFCKACYYGSRCQFTTTGFGLSLDDILGYNIRPNVSLSQQPNTVIISTAFTALMFAIAIVNGVLSYMTFQTKRSLEMGSGVYLLVSAVTSSLTMILFLLKFVLLLLSQLSVVTNRSYLLVNCICTDMLLKATLAIGDWLNGCVNIERIVTLQRGVKFNKRASRKVAKFLVIVIYLVTFTSFIHDPLHRRLLEDADEQRTWCVVHYSSSVRRYASFINILHFILPLCMNFISTIFIIILMARQKSRSREQQSYTTHLWQQFKRHKHRLFSSFMLVLIAIPRLIISFATECMKSAQNAWLYLIGYFTSFIPPLLVFVLFVLPSDFYRKEFITATIRVRRAIQRRFHRE